MPYWFWGQGHGALVFENGFRTIIDCNPPMKLHTPAPYESRMCPIDFGVKKDERYRTLVIEQWFPDHNWLCNPPMIMKFHALAPYESRMPYCLTCQRCSSWGMYDWKWFLNLSPLCNPPMIMKLHTTAPSESRMCPIDLGSKVMGYLELKIVN